MITKLHVSFMENRLVDIGDAAHKMLGSYKHLEINSVIKQLTELETLSIGKTLDKQLIKDYIDHITIDSEMVFEGLESEILEISGHK